MTKNDVIFVCFGVLCHYYQVNVLIVKHPFDGFERVFYNYFNILNLRL